MTRALLLIAGWVGRGMAAWLSTTRRPMAAEVAALRERLEKLKAENELLRSRLGKIDPHRRPRYASWERLGILLHRARYGMSLQATAKAFLITVQSLLNWMKEVESGGARVVRSRRPLNALPDLVGEVAAFLKRQWPRWGTRRIAGVLAGLGLRGSRSSVQRLLRHPPPRPAARARAAKSPLRARRADQVWVVDFTVVRRFFRSVVVGALLDAWSRKVLALRVWRTEPDAAAACLLLRDALRCGRRPVWLVSDRGSQFRSLRFKALLARHRIRRRAAAVGDANLSRIDRFWRAMKEEFADGLFLFKPVGALQRQLRSYARWHATARPHEGLGLRTPEAVYRGRVARRHRPPQADALKVAFLGGDRRLPVFRFRPVA